MEEKNGNLDFKTYEEFKKWEEQEFRKTVDKIPDEQILGHYLERYDKQPAFPMMLCSGEKDPDYIAMLRYCLKNGKPVDEEIEKMFFPMEEGAVY